MRCYNYFQKSLKIKYILSCNSILTFLYFLYTTTKNSTHEKHTQHFQCMHYVTHRIDASWLQKEQRSKT